jgi:hypothetical protein
MRSGFPVAAALMLVGVPIVVTAILLFGGGQVNACLGGRACLDLPPPAPILGLLGLDVAGPSAVALAIGWVVLAFLVARHIAARDGRRLHRAALGVVLLAGGMGIVAGGLRFLDGAARRTVVEDAALWAIGTVLVVAPLALGWAVLTVRREPA